MSFKKRVCALLLAGICVISMIIPAYADDVTKSVIFNGTTHVSYILHDNGSVTVVGGEHYESFDHLAQKYTGVVPSVDLKSIILPNGAYISYSYTSDGMIKVVGGGEFESLEELKNHYITKSPIKAGNITFSVSDGKFVIKGVQTGLQNALNTGQSKILTISRWVLSLFTIAAIGIFIVSITKLSTSSSSPGDRKKAISSIMYSGIGVAIFGSISLFVGFFWTFLK